MLCSLAPLLSWLLPQTIEYRLFVPDLVGLAERLESAPTMDKLAPTMVVGHKYMRPHSGPGWGSQFPPHPQGVLSWVSCV
ncbi:unnamed protein product [Echinostoma caproni]|uniref:Secreted protein n=1 Tax=Echinostoma caproni TaxID=27848 RepID=A0A183BCM6_9TREM|nr:unnamed protein product [Echinostoma caproni]